MLEELLADSLALQRPAADWASGVSETQYRVGRDEASGAVRDS